MKRLAFVLCLVSALPALAQDRVQEIAAANPGMTPFQVLRQFYLESPAPAHLADFDLKTDTRSNLRCAIVGWYYPNEFSDYYVYRFRTTDPSHGPLFPGGDVDHLIYSSIPPSEETDELSNALIPYLLVSTTSTDLLLEIEETERFIGSPFEVRFRRNGNLISFKQSGHSGDAYGYCYRE